MTKTETEEMLEILKPFAEFYTALRVQHQIPKTGEWYAIENRAGYFALKIEDFKATYDLYEELKNES